jgi:hypothetical protein
MEKKQAHWLKARTKSNQVSFSCSSIIRGYLVSVINYFKNLLSVVEILAPFKSCILQVTHDTSN